MRTISLKLPNEMDTRLEGEARKTGKTKSEIIRGLLATHINGKSVSSGVSCLDLVKDLVGTAKGPGDLASNPKHMRGYGK